jgi:hypothetical protein
MTQVGRGRGPPGGFESEDLEYEATRAATATYVYANDAEGIYAQGRRAQFGGRSRRNHSTVAYACLQSEVSSATLAP